MYFETRSVAKTPNILPLSESNTLMISNVYCRKVCKNENINISCRGTQIYYFLINFHKVVWYIWSLVRVCSTCAASNSMVPQNIPYG
jgi:hypothetical protein